MARQTFRASIRRWRLRTLAGFFIYLAAVFVLAYFIAEYLTEQGFNRHVKKLIIAPFILVAILIYGAVARIFTNPRLLDEVPKNPHRFTDDE